MKKYQEIIKELREDKDLTQKQLAIILNTTQSNYSKYEKGQKQLSIDQLITICKFYDISPKYILGFTKEIKNLPK